MPTLDEIKEQFTELDRKAIRLMNEPEIFVSGVPTDFIIEIIKACFSVRELLSKENYEGLNELLADVLKSENQRVKLARISGICSFVKLNIRETEA